MQPALYCQFGVWGFSLTAMGVELRSTGISKGLFSLFLDHWPPVMINGKRKRKEYLGIYVRNKPRTSAEREENALLYKMAGLKLAERKIELSTPRGIKPKVSIRR